MPVSRLRAALRLPLFLLINLIFVPAFALLRPLVRSWSRWAQVTWCTLSCRLIGLRVRAIGTVHSAGPTLYVSNHVSYLDVAVLTQLVDAVYVAKAEVKGWPLFGLIARLTGTLFVDRSAITRAREHSDGVRRHLAAGNNIVLFPEGTTTDGSGVAPFKSTLLEAAGARMSEPGVVIQPISIVYTRAADGTPLDGERAELYGWFDDMELTRHMWRVFGMKGAEVEVRFHAPVRAVDVADRKALARHCHDVVAGGVRASRAAAGGAAPAAGSATAGGRRRPSPVDGG